MMASLATQLLTVSVLSLQRQIYHNRGLRLNDPSQWWASSYDFIVVGGGLAGCTLAGRLSENPSTTVLLIEAGGPQTSMSDIMPAIADPAQRVVYFSVPQPQAARAYRESRIYYPRGRVLGGSMVIQPHMELYSRGNPRGYDEWATRFGAGPGWSWSSVLPYFLRAENQTDPSYLVGSPGLYGSRGPLQVTTAPDPDPIFKHWIRANVANGRPVIDFNGAHGQIGSAIMQTTQSRENYTRFSTASAYIEPNIGRPNLHVLVNSFVTRILFSNTAGSGSQPTATGVQFIRNGRTYQVAARRELIISAGSFQSPQLLMLSGVGPRDHLAQYRIPLIADLPVGSTLIDTSVVFLYSYAIIRNSSLIPFNSNGYTTFSLRNLFDFFANARGPLTRTPVAETYWPTGVNGDADFPDIVQYCKLDYPNPDMDASVAGYDPVWRNEWRRYIQPVAGNSNHFATGFANFRPRSAGSVRLKSADPMAAPVIDPNFFADPRDLTATVAGLVMGLRLLESPQMQPYLEYSRIPVPGCGQYWCPEKPVSACYPYLRCLAQTSTGSAGQAVASCQMGNSTNPAAVVDDRLRVRGVGRLRVVDASVMPMVPNSNIIAAVNMVAEKANDLIRQDNGIPIGVY